MAYFDLTSGLFLPVPGARSWPVFDPQWPNLKIAVAWFEQTQPWVVFLGAAQSAAKKWTEINEVDS